MPPLLFAAALLSCPVGICLMLWLMMRGNKQRLTERDAELSRLQTEIEQLRSAGRGSPGQPVPE